MYRVVFKSKKYSPRWRKILIQIYADFPNDAFLISQILQKLAGVVCHQALLRMEIHLRVFYRYWHYFLNIHFQLERKTAEVSLTAVFFSSFSRGLGPVLELSSEMAALLNYLQEPVRSVLQIER